MPLSKGRCGVHAHTYLDTQFLRCAGHFFLNGMTWYAVLCCRCLYCVSGGWTGGAELGIALIFSLRSRVSILLTLHISLRVMKKCFIKFTECIILFCLLAGFSFSLSYKYVTKLKIE